MKATLLSLCLILPPAICAGSEVPGTIPELPSESLRGPTSLNEFYSVTGNYVLSVDAIGTNSPPGLVQVEKPVGATVVAAFLATATTPFAASPVVPGTITIDGSPVPPPADSWDQTVPISFGGWSHLEDVTAIVKPIVDGAAPGIVNLSIDETDFFAQFDIDGEIVAVVFEDPNLTEEFTIALFFGHQDILGDTFSVLLAEGAAPNDPNYVLDLCLGISFGYQPGGQVSIVDVNGQTMTSSAGGQDDGDGENGALITVGGVGDSNDNPPPFAGPITPSDPDDELYDLKPFMGDGDVNITIDTFNPTNDDNIMFAGLRVSGAAIVGEGILITQDADSNYVGEEHWVTAIVQDDGGMPLPGRDVTFQVIFGPHMGLMDTDVTDANGEATFHYTGTSVGTDEIVACFIDSMGEEQCSNVLFKTWLPSPNDPPDCSNAVVSVEELWPPNHGFETVGIMGVTDPDGDPVTITITGVTQDEPLDGKGDGHTCPDAILADDQVELRAERSERGNGRVYHVSFTAEDDQGGACNGVVNICVPHSQGPANDCVDDGPLANSAGPCDTGPAFTGGGDKGGLKIQLSRGASSVATIEYSLERESFVRLEIFDVSGRRITTLVEERQATGTHHVTWSAGGTASGIYFARLEAGGRVETKSVLVLK